MKLIIIGLVSANTLRTITPLYNTEGVKYTPHDVTLGCGECIAAGHVYCRKEATNVIGSIYSDKDFPKKTAASGKPIGDEICCKSNIDTDNCKDLFAAGGAWF